MLTGGRLPEGGCMTLACDLEEAGFLVLASGEVEAAGAAYLLQLSPKTLRNMRAELDGPPWRTARRIVWYRITDVLAWRGTLASWKTTESPAYSAVRSSHSTASRQR